MTQMTMYKVQDILVGFAVGILTGVFAPKLLKRIYFKTICAKAILGSSESKISLKMVLVVRTDLGMGKGKIAAQCSHAALSAYKKALRIRPEFVSLWEATGQTKVVLRSEEKEGESGEEILYRLKKEANKLGIAAAVIHDAGRTQIATGTATVVAVGPAPSKMVDSVTGHLKLM